MSKRIIIGGGNNIKITDTEAWKDFVDKLNHPTQERVDARKRFFEECDKLIITRNDNGFAVEFDDLDEEEIVVSLSNRYPNLMCFGEEPYKCDCQSTCENSGLCKKAYYERWFSPMEDQEGEE